MNRSKNAFENGKKNFRSIRVSTGVESNEKVVNFVKISMKAVKKSKK